MAKKVPLDAPWTAARAAEWDARSISWFVERSGIRTTLARDLWESALRGLFPGDLNDISFLNLLFLIHSHGSVDTLFSIEGGSQENLVVGGAGSIARRVADDLGDVIRLSTPVRAIRQKADSVRVESAALTVSARHAVVTIPPALVPEIEFDPVLPADRLALYRNSPAGPETKTLLVYDEPFWRAAGRRGTARCLALSRRRCTREALEHRMKISPLRGWKLATAGYRHLLDDRLLAMMHGALAVRLRELARAVR